jgi:hypothetical protein
MVKRLGGPLRSYGCQPGALTFITYSLGEQQPEGVIRALVRDQQFTTTVDNLRDVFNSTLTLPPQDVIAEKIRERVRRSLLASASRK